MTDASQSEKVDVEKRAEAQRIAERFLIYGDNQAMNLAKQFLDLQAELEAAREVIEVARKISRIEATGVLPDFQPLADALVKLDAGEEG